MTTYNTSSDSANTSVRAFLTKIGEYYLKRSFNTSSGKGKEDWERIKEKVFDSKCAYCDLTKEKLQIEHLIMFNRDECGLHHPGNIVPCCKECNKRQRDKDGKYVSWEDHLASVCKNQELNKKRKKKILEHIKKEKYPDLTKDELNALKAVCDHLYDSTKTEFEKSLKLYKKIDKTLVNT